MASTFVKLEMNRFGKYISHFKKNLLISIHGELFCSWKKKTQE